MFNRYHYITGFDKKHIDQLKAITSRLNMLKWQYTRHTLDNIKYRELDNKRLSEFFNSCILKYDDIIEYYSNIHTGKIEKILYRIPYTDSQDIILVLTPEKNIVTIYLNSKDDKHITLNTSLYVKI